MPYHLARDGRDPACPWTICAAGRPRYMLADEEEARYLLHLLQSGGDGSCPGLPADYMALHAVWLDLVEQSGGQRAAARLMGVDQRRVRRWCSDPTSSGHQPVSWLAVALLRHLVVAVGDGYADDIQRMAANRGPSRPLLPGFDGSQS